MRVAIHRRLAGRLGISPRGQSAIGGFMVGAFLTLVLIAFPLWFLPSPGDHGDPESHASPTPLAALSTTPEHSSQFDITAILDGEWTGEVCPDEGEPIRVAFEFTHDGGDRTNFSVSLGAAFDAGEIVASGSCDVDGQDIAFHEFLAILSDCDEACGVDRTFEGHFDDGVLIGHFHDEVYDEACSSCVRGGTWWLEPETG